jgi:Tfp pilus assembly protein PilF
MLCSLTALLLVFFGFQVQAQEAGSTYYDLGIFAYEDGNYMEAEIHFKKALKADSGNPSYNHYMGKTYIKMDQYQDAEKFIETAWKKDPELPHLAYDRAFLYYKMSQYGKAGKFFKKVIKDDPAHVLAYFYGGICLYRDGRYKEADSYLMTSAEKSPELKVKAFYYSGLCQYYMGQDEAAIQKLSYVQANSDSEKAKSNAAKWIEKINETKKERKRYEIQAKLAYMYDDNVPIYDILEEYSDESDALILGYLSGRYNVLNREDFVLGAGLSRIQTWHFDLTEFDTSETEIDLYARYFSYPFIWGLSVLPTLHQVDGEDFLLVYQIKPEASYMINKQLTVRLSYGYLMNDYRQDDYDDMDGSTHEVFLESIRTGFGPEGKKGYFLGGIGYEYNTAEEEVHDYGEIILRAGGSFGLPFELHLGVMGNYAIKTYKEEDLIEEDTREDNRHEISLSLARNFYFDWLEIAAMYTYTHNDSNFDDYDYTRQNIAIGLTATF